MTCTNTVGGYACGACPSGYTGDGHTCTDVNECASTPCDPRAACTNSPGSYRCGACPAGFRGDGYTGCVDVDECAEHIDTCSPLVTCGNTLGSYTCDSCPAGYAGDGHSCSDVDECAAHTAQCDANVSCSNTVGSYNCGPCPGGYTGDGHTCSDIDECAAHPCDPLSACSNTAGSYSCGACPAGYQGDGYAGCVDIDECAVNNGGCPQTEGCLNQPGSRRCVPCAAGSVGQSTECGVGACAATGVTSCSLGRVVDTCTPGSPAASDATCDGVDDDWNGAADEDFAATTTRCGVGSCAATGALSCSAGAVSDSCRPLAPASTTDGCNGVDDDCDGQIDEDFVSAVTHCGAAACPGTGATRCVGGQVQDSCVAPTHASVDVTCDGVDDDCDGIADDEYPSSSVDCGGAGCAVTGTLSCSGGQVVNSCTVPGQCSSEAACDDGADNDLDNATDCQDSDCFAFVGCLYEICNDERDNDLDGAPDCRDDDCAGVDGCPPIVPDPSEVAGEMPPGRPALFSEEVQHLLFGQFGVTLTPEDFSSDRVSVLGSYVYDTAGNPLRGVKVSVRELPGAGFTYSRADGRFDLLTNAGGLVTLVYEMRGYVPVHRPVRGVWEDYAFAPDVVMTQFDTRAQTVGFPSADGAVVRGSVQNDEDGSRQATLIVPAGVQAMVMFPDGYSQPLEFGTIRATELSVGSLGRKAIAAPTATNMAYTYSTEIAIDEVAAMGHGEGRIDFSAPLAFYLDNFLNVPVGMGVPSGYFNREEASWVASDDGRVLKVVAVSGGVASLDLNGDDVAESAEELSAVGISAAEQQRVGARCMQRARPCGACR